MRPLIFFLLLLQTRMSAQRAEIPPFTMKANAGTLISPGKQAFALTTDLRIGPRASIDIGAGAFFNSEAFIRYEGESYTGLRLRTGLKYFVNPSQPDPFHVGFEVKYNNIRHLQYKDMLRQGGQYQESLLTKRKVQTIGIAGRIGTHNYYGFKKRFLLEPYLGLGVVRHHVSLEIPPDAEILRASGLFSLEYPPGKTLRMDLLLGLHIGWAFW